MSLLREIYFAVRLFVLMMIGACFDFVCAVMYALTDLRGETLNCVLGAFIGAFLGLGFHLRWGRSHGF